MNKLFSFVLFSLFVPFILQATSSAEASKQMMSNDIDLIKSIFEVKYAPAEWKKSYSGWDLDAEVQSVKETISQKSLLSTRDYQKLLLNFFHSMKDYHVSVGFYATEMSFLPFRIQGAEGHYFITWIANNPSAYSNIDPNLANMITHTKIGDEVISMNGIPTDEYLGAFKSEVFGKNPNGTDQMLSEQFLTLRQASRGFDVPQGPLEIVIKHRDTNKIETYSPQWMYLPEQIKSHYAASTSYPTGKKKKINLFDKMMITPLYSQLENAEKHIQKFISSDSELKKPESDSDFLVLGQYKSFIPPLGKVVWSLSNSHYYAYIFETPEGKRIGYVRIPTYAVGGSEYKDFEKLMQIFQNETEALVIDQVNNPGGSVAYLFSLLSMLTDYPLEMPQERMTITQQDVSEALMIVENPEETLEDLIVGIAGFKIAPEELPLVTAFFQSIIDEWNAGRSFTNQLYYWGIPSIKPNANAHYNKPILLLVNYLDFSCADFFPAILQDNGRAKIFGSKTAGAGGFVLWHEYPNLFGISGFSYTGSIAYRTNNNPIENLGVTPDFPYEITESDLTDGYKSYAQAVNNALESLLNQ